MAVQKKPDTLHIDPLKQGRITVKLIGTTPLYFNSMSSKAKRDLLIGGQKKTAAQKKEIKHNPEQEYRDSVYMMSDGETALGFPAPGVKGAMATAALETAGVAKTSVQRLIFLPEQKIRIWGKPYLSMSVVRSADTNKTPDIRTRAMVPRWCSEVDIAYVMPTFSAHSIVSLLANAGMVVGIGDFRQEKGRGSFGSFQVAGDDLGDLQGVWDEVTAQGRMVQLAALAQPEPADDETAELMQLLAEERARRAA